MRRDGADAAAAEEVALDAQHSEGGVVGGRAGPVAGPNAQRAHVERPDLARHPPPAENRDHLGAAQADAAAVEERRSVAPAEHALPAQAAGGPEAPAREREDAPAFEEELPLLRKEEVEAGQVHLLLVHLHLCEVGVVGEVGGQVLGEAVLEVDAERTVTLPPLRWLDAPIGRHAADGVGLDLERLSGRRRLEADQRAGRGDPEDAAAPAEAGGRDRDQRQVGPLVLADHGAPELNAPDLLARWPVTQRLERHHHLDRPAAVEAVRLDVPHRVPVAVRIPLVGDLLIDESAERVRVEEERVAPVVERVDQEAEQVVVQHVAGVALHVGRRPFARRGAVPAAAGHVEVLLVEHHPGIGPLRRRRALVGELLDEVGDRRDVAVDRLVEPSVDAEPGRQPDGAHRRPTAVAGHHRRRNRRRRVVDGGGRLRRGGRSGKAGHGLRGRLREGAEHPCEGEAQGGGGPAPRRCARASRLAEKPGTGQAERGAAGRWKSNGHAAGRRNPWPPRVHSVSNAG